MKALTHNIFSVGLGLYLVLRLAQQPLLEVLLVIWLAFATNGVIDSLGHRTRGGMAVRSFVTHSIFTAPLWGIAVAVSSLYLLDLMTGQKIGIAQLSAAAGLGVLLAFSHLFLDALTEGGVFYGRHRMALAHFSNNNEILNGIFAGLGAVLIAATFY
ncbi:MAG: DUF1286 domain-containing protein [Thaumarchaeota archaeon]|nr:DUF1286 domain-containing protein [Nitrososphaerota archaeon]